MGTLFHIRYECAKWSENVSEPTPETLVTVELHQNETGLAKLKRASRRLRERTPDGSKTMKCMEARSMGHFLTATSPLSNLIMM
jgi:hypothetical protein